MEIACESLYEEKWIKVRGTFLALNKSGVKRASGRSAGPIINVIPMPGRRNDWLRDGWTFDDASESFNVIVICPQFAISFLQSGLINIYTATKHSPDQTRLCSISAARFLILILAIHYPSKDQRLGEWVQVCFIKYFPVRRLLPG